MPLAVVVLTRTPASPNISTKFENGLLSGYFEAVVHSAKVGVVTATVLVVVWALLAVRPPVLRPHIAMQLIADDGLHSEQVAAPAHEDEMPTEYTDVGIAREAIRLLAPATRQSLVNLARRLLSIFTASRQRQLCSVVDLFQNTCSRRATSRADGSPFPWTPSDSQLPR